MVDLGDVTFAAMVVVTIGGGVTALEAREIVYGAIGLAFSFFGVAGLFFLLDAPFVAVFQITVYVGAVAVLILFTVMLVREGRWLRDTPRPWGKISGILTAVALAASLILAFAASSLLKATEQATASQLRQHRPARRRAVRARPRGAGAVLAAAVLGAMMLAKIEGGRGGDEQEEGQEEEGGMQK